MKLLYNNLLDVAAPILTEGSEIVGMESSKLAVPQLVEKWRASLISASDFWAQVNLDETKARVEWNTIAMIGMNLTQHRNSLRFGWKLDDAVWVKTNCTVTAQGAPIPVSGSRPYRVSEVGGPPSHFQQTYTKPDSSSFNFRLMGYYAHDDSIFDSNMRLYMEGATSGDNAQADFDLQNGTIDGSPSTAGGFSAVTAQIIDTGILGREGKNYFKCILRATTDSAATVELRAELLDSSFSPPSVGVKVLAAAMTADALGNSDDDVFNMVGNRAALYRLASNLAGFANPPAAGFQITGWSNIADAKIADGRDLISFTRFFSGSLSGHRAVNVELDDPNNLDAVGDVGRMVVGKAVEFPVAVGGLSVQHLGRRHRFDFSLEAMTDVQKADLEEAYRIAGQKTPGESETRGGQLYRDQLPVLAIIDEFDPVDFRQDYLIYGYLEGAQPIIHKVSDWWDAEVSIVELVG